MTGGQETSKMTPVRYGHPLVQSNRGHTAPQSEWCLLFMLLDHHRWHQAMHAEKPDVGIYRQMVHQAGILLDLHR